MPPLDRRNLIEVRRLHIPVESAIRLYTANPSNLSMWCVKRNKKREPQREAGTMEARVFRGCAHRGQNLWFNPSADFPVAACLAYRQ